MILGQNPDEWCPKNQRLNVFLVSSSIVVGFYRLYLRGRVGLERDGTSCSGIGSMCLRPGASMRTLSVCIERGRPHCTEMRAKVYCLVQKIGKIACYGKSYAPVYGEEAQPAV